jgi:hypothetical protein
LFSLVGGEIILIANSSDHVRLAAQ